MTLFGIAVLIGLLILTFLAARETANDLFLGRGWDPGWWITSVLAVLSFYVLGTLLKWGVRCG